MLAFLGAGAMGTALLRGWIAAELAVPGRTRVFAPTAAKTRALAEELGITASPDALSAAQEAELLIVAVKPHLVEKALLPLRELAPSTTVVSVAAGVSLAKLQACFAHPVPLVRVMPNTPSLVGAGASALCAGLYATPEQIARVRQLFDSVGLTVEVPETLIDAVTGLSGSGPAYVYLFIEALSDGGVRAGLPREMATRLAAQTVLGAARMVLETGQHPGALKDAVTSPGGTTIAALGVLERGAMRGLVMDAVRESAQRSRELGSG